MYQMILNNTPETWKHGGIIEQQTLQKYSQEYEDVESDLRNAAQDSSFEIVQIDRIQKVHHYGQFLLREQLLAVNNKDTSYYRVRRFVQINKLLEKEAIKYNLDTRRIYGTNRDLYLSRSLTLPASNNLIFVVRVVTDSPLSETITPTNTLEYYIEYVAEVRS